MKLSTGYDRFLVIYDDHGYTCYFKYCIGLGSKVIIEDDMEFKEDDVMLPDILLNIFSEKFNPEHETILKSEDVLIFSKIMESFDYEYAAKFI